VNGIIFDVNDMLTFYQKCNVLIFSML